MYHLRIFSVLRWNKTEVRLIINFLTVFDKHDKFKIWTCKAMLAIMPYKKWAWLITEIFIPSKGM